jgi:hypothetical protein
MSAHISEQSFQYVGILNGVMYRIDPLSGRSIEPIFASQSLTKWSDEAEEEASADVSVALPNVSAEAAPASEMAAEAAGEDVVPVSNLFPRSGAEPLRAGHPDLWALLVAGTCLEGSEYRSE